MNDFKIFFEDSTCLVARYALEEYMSITFDIFFVGEKSKEEVINGLLNFINTQMTQWISNKNDTKYFNFYGNLDSSCCEITMQELYTRINDAEYIVDTLFNDVNKVTLIVDLPSNCED